MFHRKSYIEELIAQGEGQNLDFKFNISDSRKIARSLVAFSNSGGGTLLIGVRDNGSIAGIRSDEELYMLEAALNTYSKPEIDVGHQIWEIEKKTVLEVKISEGDQKPYYSMDENGKWLAYIRVDDENILANKILIKYWQRLSNPDGTFIRYSEKEKKLLNYLEENEDVSFSKIRNLLEIPNHIAENIIVNLLSINLMRYKVVEGKFFYSLK